MTEPECPAPQNSLRDDVIKQAIKQRGDEELVEQLKRQSDYYSDLASGAFFRLNPTQGKRLDSVSKLLLRAATTIERITDET